MKVLTCEGVTIRANSDDGDDGDGDNDGGFVRFVPTGLPRWVDGNVGGNVFVSGYADAANPTDSTEAYATFPIDRLDAFVASYVAPVHADTLLAQIAAITPAVPAVPK